MSSDPLYFCFRFDLIFLILDPQDEEFDGRLGRHLISLYHRSKEEEEETDEFLKMDLLKDYIGYARSNFHPVLSPEAKESLKHAYVEMRKIGSSRGQITAYPRQLESLIRLAEAHAKMRFKNVVDIDDVEEAKRLHREAIKQAAIDPTSGKIDISILTTGMSTSNRKRRQEIIDGLKHVLIGMRNEKMGADSESQPSQLSFSYQEVFSVFKSNSTLMITRDMFEDALRQLKDDGFLFVVGNKSIRLCV